MHLACASGDLDCVRALTERITTSEETNGVSCTGVLLSKSAEGATNAKQTRQHFIQYADVELINYDGKFYNLTRSFTSGRLLVERQFGNQFIGQNAKGIPRRRDLLYLNSNSFRDRTAELSLGFLSYDTIHILSAMIRKWFHDIRFFGVFIDCCAVEEEEHGDVMMVELRPRSDGTERGI